MPEQPYKDSSAYLAKKRFYDQILTIYGRKPVLEALRDTTITLHRLHLAETNRRAPIIEDMLTLAKQRGAEVLFHSKQALARISKNSRQDQGVAADVVCQKYQNYQCFLREQAQHRSSRQHFELLALDRITNPQNLGMIVRSVCAGQIDGLLLPRQGCAKIDSLVIKASAGTVFKARIIHCDTLLSALPAFKQQGCEIVALSSSARKSIVSAPPKSSAVYVLGNESDGVSTAVAEICSTSLAIPMNNGVESLNVAVTAALIAFRQLFH